MEDNTIESLYRSVTQITEGYLNYKKRNNIELVKKIIPQIQEFVLWFLEGNRFGIEEELYVEMQTYLLQVLEDILSAIDMGDRVLLHDAVAYGLKEYLELFAGSKQEEKENDSL